MNNTKRIIFEKSMELFANKGYEATSIEEITSVVGIAKGTFYYHFSKKEDLFNFLIKDGMDLLKNSISIKTKKQNNTIEKIKAIILIQIKVTVKYENFIRFIIGQIWGNEEKNKMCREYIEEYIEIIEKIVQEGIEKKEIKKCNTRITAYGIFSVLLSSLMNKSEEDKDINKLHKEYSDYIVKLLK